MDKVTKQSLVLLYGPAVLGTWGILRQAVITPRKIELRDTKDESYLSICNKDYFLFSRLTYWVDCHGPWAPPCFPVSNWSFRKFEVVGREDDNSP